MSVRLGRDGTSRASETGGRIWPGPDVRNASDETRTVAKPVARVTLPIKQEGENPRTTRVRKVVLEASTTLFIEEGYRAVTPQRVSQETGVARSTIYRHWPDQQALLLDTIDVVVFPHGGLEWSGDLRADLVSALEGLRRRLDRRPFRDIFAALLEHANRSREIVPAQRRAVEGVLAPTREVIESAVADGRLELSGSAEDAVARLAGPLMHQHVMLRERITDELISTTIDGFLATSASKSARRS